MRGHLTPSLFMLGWLSFLAAAVHVEFILAGSMRNSWERPSFLVAESLCLLAGLTEAGGVEAGRHGSIRRPLQAAALLGFLAYVLVTSLQ